MGALLPSPQPTGRLPRGTRPEALVALAERVRPQSLAGDELLPLLPGLQATLGLSGLRRGSVVAVAGEEGRGARSLTLSLLAAVTTGGVWCSAVGITDFGAIAAHELGVCLERLALVSDPGRRAGQVLGALVEGCDVVLLGLPLELARQEMLRLAARARQRRIVLLVTGSEREVSRWPEVPDVVLSIRSSELVGITAGSGRILARRAQLEMRQRRGAPSSAVALWLPSEEGELRPLETDGERPFVVPMRLAEAQ